MGGEELGGKKRDVGEQRKREGTHAFSDLFPLGESSSRCEYCGSSVHIFLLHCSSCIFLDVFSFYSLFGCNFSATLSFFFYDFHLRIFMHMRASESHIYSLSFPVRGAWSMHRYLYFSLTSSRSYPHVFTVRSAHLHPIYIPCITPLCIHTCPYLNHTS